MTSIELSTLSQDIQIWGHELGFQSVGICDTDLTQAESELFTWLQNGYHGEMDWMQKHGVRRSRPAELESGTLRIISVRMDYWPEHVHDADKVLNTPAMAYVSRYALGRDYHKLMRQRLQRLADRIQQQVGDFGYRVFVDSAPVMEKPLAQKAGLGWIGKHTNLIAREAGSWFFLGEIYTNLPLEVDDNISANHCGTCQSCIDVCPTNAIVAPYKLDARLCISYLTIELRGSIPEKLRPLIGNRIYGCDDCQLVCPWNRFAVPTKETDFSPRHQLDHVSLVDLFSWDEQTFLDRLAGSPIRRIGYECWLRNIAVALGNAETKESIVKALEAKRDHASSLVREHVTWALSRHAR